MTDIRKLAEIHHYQRGCCANGYRGAGWYVRLYDVDERGRTLGIHETAETRVPHPTREAAEAALGDTPIAGVYRVTEWGYEYVPSPDDSPDCDVCGGTGVRLVAPPGQRQMEPTEPMVEILCDACQKDDSPDCPDCGATWDGERPEGSRCFACAYRKED